jgi:hypothetical protein
MNNQIIIDKENNVVFIQQDTAFTISFQEEDIVLQETTIVNAKGNLEILEVELPENLDLSKSYKFKNGIFTEILVQEENIIP